MDTVSGEEYGLLEYWSIVRKRWPWVLLPALVVAGAAGFYSVSEGSVYQSTAQVLLADTALQRTLDPSSQGFTRELSNEISLARGDTVETLVADELGKLPSIVITPGSGADVLVFTARGQTAEDAALFANTWASKYIQVKRDGAVNDISAATATLQVRLSELRAERQALRAPLDELDEQIQRSADEEVAVRLQRQYDRLADDLRYELELTTEQAEAAVRSLAALELQAELATVGEARVVQVAAPPGGPSNTPVWRTVVYGLTIGLMAGLGLALLAETRDKTIKSASDIQGLTSLPVLASIPAAGKKQMADLPFSTHRDPEGMFADAYHKVRSSLEFVSLEGDIRTVLITSPNASEGKSTTACNLALALSSVGKRTVLLDVDFRRARVHRIFGIPQMPGVTDVVLSGVEMGSVAYSIQEPGLTDLLVAPAGTTPPSPAAFVGTSGFLGTLEWLRSQADVVVMDAPPLLAVSDAHTLGKHVDAVILTAMAGQTTKGELAEVLTVMSQVGANVIGVVLVGVDEAESYGKGYYYRSKANAPAAGPSNTQNLWGQQGGGVIDLNQQQDQSPGRVLK
jgi:capsular exopolysaccharide synthesis family protein